MMEHKYYVSYVLYDNDSFQKGSGWVVYTTQTMIKELKDIEGMLAVIRNTNQIRPDLYINVVNLTYLGLAAPASTQNLKNKNTKTPAKKTATTKPQ